MSVYHLGLSFSRNVLHHRPFETNLTTCTVQICQCVMPHFSLIFKNGTHIFCLVFPLFLLHWCSNVRWCLRWTLLPTFFVVSYCYCHFLYNNISSMCMFFSLAWSLHIHHSNISSFYQMADGKCETSQMRTEMSRWKDGSAYQRMNVE